MVLVIGVSEIETTIINVWADQSLTMLSLIFEHVYQRGPMGSHMDQVTSSYLFAGFAVLLLGAVLLILFFPRLEGVSVTGDIRPEVELMEESRGNEAEIGRGGASAVDVALRLLEPDERRVVEALVATGGTMLQKDISYELEISRVKIHRILVRLLKRGVVSAEKEHNTNRIKLADWLKE